MFHEDVLARLLASPELMAGLQGGVHWGALPQAGRYPALRLSQVSEYRPTDMDGDAGLPTYRVQMDLIAEDKAEQYRTVLKAKSVLVEMWSAYSEGRFGQCNIVTGLDKTERDLRSGGLQRRVQVDVQITYREDY